MKGERLLVDSGDIQFVLAVTVIGFVVQQGVRVELTENNLLGIVTFSLSVYATFLLYGVYIMERFLLKLIWRERLYKWLKGAVFLAHFLTWHILMANGLVVLNAIHKFGWTAF